MTDSDYAFDELRRVQELEGALAEVLDAVEMDALVPMLPGDEDLLEMLERARQTLLDGEEEDAEVEDDD